MKTIYSNLFKPCYEILHWAPASAASMLSGRPPDLSLELTEVIEGHTQERRGSETVEVNLTLLSLTSPKFSGLSLITKAEL